ncbi:MAG: succinate dehydrogenase cytochrome b subunit [Leptolyngbyaceae bacterium]|nr:succinate dehydrogenase cytochrome b subunit [Leptolyngbyaceae bacterium]
MTTSHSVHTPSSSESVPSKSAIDQSAIEQSPIETIYQSSIGKKILTGITGLGLVIFIVAHLLGNLLLFISPDAYNQYGHVLEGLGPLLWAVEILLLLVILVHASIGVQIYLNKRRARPVGYDTYQSAGQPSQQTLSSKTMIWTGIVLAAFIGWHVVSFKFGPHYGTSLDGSLTPVRDLYRLVVEAFQTLGYTVTYTVALILLGFHLRHGIWSALQSLGLLDRMTLPAATRLSVAIATILTIGFLSIPWAIYTGLIS